MDFEPTDAQREVQRRAREVASELIAPQAAELDLTERFPVETFRELGFTSVNLDLEGLVSGKLNRR